ncbi:hypothetical protein ACFTQ7_24650 [Lysinibacillus sp. NPDC056959]|uniref:hypothetical protein n=1 Tax=Lysinibacillus sp. NPDC056959 TaxID=3345981 RepID=UPI003634E88E
MKKPKKFHLDTKLCELIDSISEHYKVSRSVFVEELILSVLMPDKFYIQTTLILNDDFYKEQVEKYLLEG